MILLIQGPHKQRNGVNPSFKFHYDSINSSAGPGAQVAIVLNLNSIMILLILQRHDRKI